MGAGLYEAAFATVVRLYGSAARDAITSSVAADTG
jgi:hypothetical protein